MTKSKWHVAAMYSISSEDEETICCTGCAIISKHRLSNITN